MNSKKRVRARLPPKTVLHCRGRMGPWVRWEVTSTVMQILINFLAEHQGRADDKELVACRHALFGQESWAYEAGGLRIELTEKAIFGKPLLLISVSNGPESNYTFDQALTNELNRRIASEVMVHI